MALVTIAVINNHRAAPAARCLRTPSAPGATWGRVQLRPLGVADLHLGRQEATWAPRSSRRTELTATWRIMSAPLFQRARSPSNASFANKRRLRARSW
jgi:hypothetical protein